MEENKIIMKNALNDLKLAFKNVSTAWENYNIDDLNVDSYPFDKDFQELVLDVIGWVQDINDKMEN